MQVFVKLQVTSNKMDAIGIEASLKIKPDTIWSVGDVRKNTIIQEKNNGWAIECRVDDCESVEEPLSLILDRLAQNISAFNVLSDDCEILLRCAVYSEEVPSFYITNECLKRISLMNADLDFDLYLTGIKS